MGNRLLLIDDDESVAELVHAGLEPWGFAVEHAPTLVDGRRQVRSGTYDAILLDLGLPDGSGLELADELRAGGNDVPILMLTAQSAVPHRVAGFAHGADDYLCKPFAVEELVARLRAVLARVRPERQHILRYADLELDLLNRVVRRAGLEAVLSDRELDLLAYMVRHPDEVLSRARLVAEVWGGEAEGESNVLNVYVNYLRNKLEMGRYPRLIHTIRGIGYMLSRSRPEEDPHLESRADS